MRTGRKLGRWVGITAIASIALGVLSGAVIIQRESAQRAEFLQEQRRRVPPPNVARYVTSDHCQACHPDQHASWRRTYHSTMTQLPSEATVVGDFDDHLTKISTGEYQFFRRGDEYWIRLPRWRIRQLGQLLGIPTPPRRQRVVLITGFHHQQVYWISLDDRLVSAGVNWVRDFERYAPHQEVFLKPARRENHRGLQEWTTNCVKCHSTPAWRGFPARSPSGKVMELLHPMGPLSLTDRRPDKTNEIPSAKSPLMPELGIACEDCHGPAEEHVQTYASPLRRYAAHLGVATDPHIVNPLELSAAESTELCGSCHAPRRRFRIGSSEAERAAHGRAPNVAWPDGMIRSGGRGYLAVTSSPCYRGGEFSCLSCHSMHDAPPDDQLAQGMDGNRACFQCHEDFESRLEAHTHHEHDSPGSLCYNCHMPHTAFNLLKATRSHQVDSPDVGTNLATGRPNACNLCHLDRSLGWTAQALSEWYEQPEVALSEENRSISAAVVGVLRGDALQRALYAWSMGWPAAQRASGQRWMSPLLAILLDDPYPAVRAVATRSLRTLPGFTDFQVDPWRPNALGGSAKQRALALRDGARPWDGERPTVYRPGNEVPVDANGNPDWSIIHALLAARDDRPIQISE